MPFITVHRFRARAPDGVGWATLRVGGSPGPEPTVRECSSSPGIKEGKDSNPPGIDVDGGLPTGAIVGITIAVIAGLAFLILRCESSEEEGAGNKMEAAGTLSLQKVHQGSTREYRTWGCMMVGIDLSG